MVLMCIINIINDINVCNENVLILLLLMCIINVCNDNESINNV